MLTAVIAAQNDPVALADTLAALVPAAVDGLVRRVLVVTDGPAAGDVATLIEASGADHLISTASSDKPSTRHGRAWPGHPRSILSERKVVDARPKAGHDGLLVDALTLWRAGLAVAPPGWRLCLAAGMVPVGEWQDAVVRHCARPDAGPAVFSVRGAWRVLLAAGAARFAGRVHPAAGLLLREAAIPARLRMTRLRARLEDRRAPR